MRNDVTAIGRIETSGNLREKIQLVHSIFDGRIIGQMLDGFTK
jgi:hypothetical protein